MNEKKMMEINKKSLILASVFTLFIVFFLVKSWYIKLEPIFFQNKKSEVKDN